MQDVIYDLQGTCQSLQAVLERHGLEDTEEVTQAIDAEVFCCETCDWWCERSEESVGSPGNCDECEPDEEDPEDEE